MPLIEVQNLRKEFKRQKRRDGFWPLMKSLVYREYEQKVAVEDISFTIDQGEIVGYIGPNGAGKSTTIKMMVGILVPTSGAVHVNGLVPFENRIKNARRIGAVFGQKSQLWWDTPVIESLRLTKYMYDIPEDRYQQNMALFGDILGLDEFKNVAVRSLSLGQRMRADLCAALLHDPDIVYLDEPTIGLDVVVKERIREFIREINRERGTTVILTTHDMSDIEKLCSRVMVVDHGKLMYDGNLTTLKNDYGNMETMELDTEEVFVMDDALLRMGITSSQTEEARTQLVYDKKNINSSAVIKWIMDRYSVRDFKVKETEIEEIIRNLYAGFSQEERPRQEVMA
ncbi:ABC transporter ATP-binding protein [Paenibacillus radicis (ex Gao et al. 2016)]|uniref:ABC transporter ATP-binding protein n=1 Tax=Paenibacillus radicis (ex Gao et al. 2016) TaxID=1737354 RepID=A0A917LYN8_9BACL|nr:ATP-binding cassette domain-containing protein [Paenibacillus radicis (ex Gao et al. 2016)]GGG64415.1 ABC transporter ATP-binding protein [Paenibacillus radicis (ex Gao et al. 2016)]